MVTRMKLELQLDRPTEIELLYDDCVEGTNQYGIYYLYAVRADGREYSYFPSETVHAQLKSLNKGDKAVITKRAMQQGNKLITDYEVETVPKRSETSNTLSIGQNSNSTNDNTSDHYYGLLLGSYKDALNIQSELNGLVDVNKIAVTLFIARSKHTALC